jgi:PAS domain S-box-containing protein
MDKPRGFIPAEVPADEAERLRDLATYGLLDTPPEAEFDRIARLAAKVLGVPIALVTLVDERRQWFKARLGLDLDETPREIAFCAHAILADAPMSVADARADARFAENPLVVGPPHIRAYAGAPIVTPRGHRLGTVCVLDVAPRHFTDHELDLLRDLAALAQERMEPRRALAGRSAVPAHVVSLLQGLLGVMFQYEIGPDARMRYTYLSDGVSALAGASAKEVVADPERFFSRVPPDDRAVIHAETVAASNEGRNVCIEHRVDAPSGQRWLRMLAMAEPSADGAKVWNGVLIDITEQKKAEEQIGRERAQLRRLIDVLPDAVFIRDRDGRYLFANRAEGHEHGMPPSELVGRTLFDLPLTSERADYLLAEDRGIIDGVLEAPPTRQWTRPDGRSITYRVTKVPFEFEGRAALLGVVADGTDQVTVAAARLDAEHRFRLLTEISPDVIIRLDLQGRIVYASLAIEHVLGYGQEEVVGHSTDLVHKEDRATLASRFSDVLAGGIPAGAIIRLRHKNGAYVWMEVLGRLARDPGSGAPLEVVIVARDVTERKSYELELEGSRMQLLVQSAELLALAESLKQSRDEAIAAREAAMLANSAKAQFLANMSHELRTPLNAVLGFSDFMLSGASGEMSERHRSYLADIKASGEHLLAMVNDMLDLARIDAGRLDLRLARVDGRALVEDCLAMLAPRAQAKALDLRLLPGPDLQILADPTRLRQILINLITNAVKFTPDGGRVTITLAAENGEAAFTVADTGRGMTAEDIRLALEPFRQVKSDIREQQEGAGLGLPITRALVEPHGGRLEIDSVLGEGTSVRFRLPNPPP